MSSSILLLLFRRAEEEYEALVKVEESRMTARGYRPKVHILCVPVAKHVQMSSWWNVIVNQQLATNVYTSGSFSGRNKI